MVGLDRRIAVQQRDHSLAVSGHILFLHDHHIAGKDPVIAHGGPLDPQGEGVSSAEHAFGDLNAFSLGDGFDGIAGGDRSDQWNSGRWSDGLQSHFDDAGDGAGPALIASNGQPLAFELIRKPLLGETKSESGAFKFLRRHVSNGYIPGGIRVKWAALIEL